MPDFMAKMHQIREGGREGRGRERRGGEERGVCSRNFELF